MDARPAFVDAALAAAREQPFVVAATAVVLTWFSLLLYRAFYNIYQHPLSRFPGPRSAAVTTYYKAFIELVIARSWHLQLESLHQRYGDVVRVGPNEIHFSDPKAYHEIYNNKNRWDKEINLYHSFGEDRSSFGFLTYAEAKERKDVLNKSFSAKAIVNARGLVQDKVDALCDAFARCTESGKLADLTFAFRSMTMDIITYYSFGTSVNAIDEPNFQAPILLAMDASMPTFVAFKHSSAFKNMIIKCPPGISRVISPATAGLINLQEILGKQIEGLYTNPQEKLKLLPHSNTIYHQLLDKDSHKNGTTPSPGSLYEEGQALMFAGADTVGNTLMLAAFHICRAPPIMQKLKAELATVMPDATTPPELSAIEKLPYTNACIKEALRMASGVISGLPRHVPPEGATISNRPIHPGTIVSIGSTFVHYNESIFPEPHVFKPERWLGNSNLDEWLVSFSRGPRSCLGINLAWVELRLALATVFRRFDMELDDSSPQELVFRETFLPMFQGPHVMMKMTKVTA